MLRPVPIGPQVVVCSTCRYSAEARENADGQRGGALLATALHDLRAADPDLADITIVQMPCLFACSSACAILVRETGKIGYLLGDFTPDEATASAILSYMTAYAASDEGVVPYAQWPQAVRGHFIARIPPAGFVAV